MPGRRSILSQLAGAHPAIAAEALTVSEEVSPLPYLETGESGLPIGPSQTVRKRSKHTNFNEQSR